MKAGQRGKSRILPKKGYTLCIRARHEPTTLSFPSLRYLKLTIPPLRPPRKPIDPIREEDFPIATQFSLWRSAAPLMPFLWALALLTPLSGCGGGGSKNTVTPVFPNNPNPTPGISAIAGRVTDINGAPVVGAAISVQGLTATTSQFGTYRLEGVTIPAGDTSLLVDVKAQKTIYGRAWSGQNAADVLIGNATTNNVQIVLSPTALQGAVAGTVRDTNGTPLSGASVYASQAVSAGTDPTFTNLSAFLEVTATDGSYRFPALPPGTRYKLVAQYPGRANAIVNGVTVSTAQTTPQNFTLTRPPTSPELPAPDAFSVISLTAPAEPTRAAGVTPLGARGGTNALLHEILKAKGLLKKQEGQTGRVFTRLSRTRAASNTLIENILSWQYREYSTLYGYRILRSVSNDTSFYTYATVQDPLAERFTDTASDLTAGTSYYYNLVRLDTVNYPQDGTEGALDVNNTLVTVPLGRATLTAPLDGATVSAVPTFGINAIGRAATYKVLVYNTFPDLQSDTDVDGVSPIWTGTKNVTTNTGVISLPYGQTNETNPPAVPTLQRGQRYYYAIIASDDVNSAFSVSPIYSFIIQ